MTNPLLRSALGSINAAILTAMQQQRGSAYTLDQFLEAWFTEYKVQPYGLLQVKLQKAPSAPIDTLDIPELIQLISFQCRTDFAQTFKNVQIAPIAIDQYLTMEVGRKCREKAVQELTEAIKYRPLTRPGSDSTSELEKWLSALTGGQINPLDLTVMEHFLWQVKRKIHKLEVVEHMMPIITGPQGTGKSYAISHGLITPLKKFARVSPVDFLTSEKNYKSLSQHYVIFLDEMAKIANTDGNHLKQVISANMLSYRVFHTQETGLAPQNCTFIGTSNEDINDLIKDSTGTRRFWEIKTGNVIDHDGINAVDYDLLWQQVDERADPPPIYKENKIYLRALREVQTEQTNKSAFELFVEEYEAMNAVFLRTEDKADDTEQLVRVDTDALYKEFKGYCDDGGYFKYGQQLSKNRFIKKLRTKYDITYRRTRDGGSYYMVKPLNHVKHASGITYKQTQQERAIAKIRKDS